MHLKNKPNDILKNYKRTLGNSMSKEALDQYRSYEPQLWLLRVKSLGKYTHDEDSVVDAMTELWYQLTDQEIAELDKEGPQCFPTEAFFKYIKLQDELYKIWKTHPKLTDAEQDLAEHMAQVWHELKDKERTYIKNTYKTHKEISHDAT